MKYMVVCGPSGSVFVKDRDYFISQGGLTDVWGGDWKPVQAKSIEDAREQGCKLFASARPYADQAK